MDAYNRRKPREYRAKSDLRLKRGLILKRTVGEQVCIGADVIVTLLSTEGPVGQLHIHAPRELAVDRAEVRKTKKLNGACDRRQ